MGERDMLQMLKLAQSCTDIIACISLIKSSNDSDEVKLFIKLITNAKQCIIPSTTLDQVKLSIKEGNGDFNKIQQHCIDLGVV